MREIIFPFVLQEKIQGWAKNNDADAIRPYSMEQLKKDVLKMLNSQNSHQGIWVFGYGSLMWNPDVRF